MIYLILIGFLIAYLLKNDIDISKFFTIMGKILLGWLAAAFGLFLVTCAFVMCLL